MRYEWIHRIKWAGCLLGLWAAVAACTAEGDEPIPASGETIHLYTKVTGREASADPVGKGEELYARLLFWLADDYHRMVDHPDEPWTEPFLAIDPDRMIDYYRVDNRVPFNTKHSYPAGDRIVHAMGYAPAEELTTTDNYKTLSIPESLQNGKTDFLSGDGNRYRVGSSSAPFDSVRLAGDEQQVELQKKQVEFCHLTAKILVEGQRHENMVRKIGVRNVKVTLHNRQVPTRLVWRPITGTDVPELGGYFPADPVSKDIYLRRADSDPIMLSTNQKVDSCYVYAPNSAAHYHDQTSVENGTIELSLDVQAELMPYDANTQNWDESQAEVREWTGQTVYIRSNTGNQLKMGYAYKIVIVFDIYDIRLQGVEMEWESGGTHYIPITPKE